MNETHDDRYRPVPSARRPYPPDFPENGFRPFEDARGYERPYDRPVGGPVMPGYETSDRYRGEYRHYGGYGTPRGGNVEHGRRADAREDWPGAHVGYRGRGPKNFRRSDERIREDVAELLTESPDLDASEIELEVNEGCVLLRGTVHGRREKRLAEDLAERVWGVHDVKNDLRLSSADARAA